MGSQAQDGITSVVANVVTMETIIPERVVIVTTNGLQLEGTFLGGVGALAAPKQKRFLPLVDVVLSHTDQPTTRLSVPFVAVNNDAIAAFTPGEGEPR